MNPATVRADSLLLRLLHCDELLSNSSLGTAELVAQARTYLTERHSNARSQIAMKVIDSEHMSKRVSGLIAHLVALLEEIDKAGLSDEAMYAVLDGLLYKMALHGGIAHISVEKIEPALLSQKRYENLQIKVAPDDDTVIHQEDPNTPADAEPVAQGA